jgi:catechol 2,3-dioxygenase-like lactoylglutathione lyase family enzyme
MSDRFDHLHIVPRDFDASIRFYRDILCWQVTSEWTDEDGKRCARLSGGGVRIVLAETQPAHGTRDLAASAAANSVTVHLDIHDADQRFARIANGDHLMSAPQANHRGRRGFVVRDPDGNLIAFNEMRQKS